MGTMQPKVILTRKLPDITERRMCELFDVQINATNAPMTADALKEAVRSADVLVPTVTDRITADVLAAAQGGPLRLIANFGVGMDHIDVDAAHRYGITVTNTPDVLTEDTADMTLALMLAVPRRLAEGERMIRSNQWAGWSPTHMLGHRVWGKKLGIIGMGRIGMAVARRALGFGMEIHYHNRNRLPEDLETEYNATYWPSLDQMLARMDIVTIHCPHTPATFHLLSERRLALLKENAVLVNTARGEVVDEKALVKLLKANKIAGAGLDVFEHEPAINPALIRMDNVVLLPHMGSATVESRVDMGDLVMINIKTFIDGHRPPNRVLPGML
jgi:glyoxylate reductase